MVKDFQLFITHPPQGVFVSNVTGHVLVVTEEAMQAKLQVHPSDPKGTTSGKDTLLSVHAVPPVQ